jgi:tRNA threonylcarbamoyladenosine modification (KEOPS) complex Cgi121 subunit
MLKPMEEYGKFAEISGFKKTRIEDTKAFLGAIREELPADVEIQLFDADLVATWEHLYFALLNALMAFKNKRNISNSVAVETALYASSQGQIKKAIELIGVKPESRNVAIVVLGIKADTVKAGLNAVAELLCVKPDETVLGLSEAKVKRIRKTFDVSATELETISAKADADRALVNLVIERVALLSTRT